jgi:hypothetical protein
MGILVIILLFVIAGGVFAAIQWYIVNVRMGCWETQGRTIGIKGEIKRVIPSRSASFRWKCDTISELIGNPGDPGGELVKLINAVAGNQAYTKKTLFENDNDSTTITLDVGSILPPGRLPPWATSVVRLKFHDQPENKTVSLSAEAAALFLLNLQAQFRNCCF